MFLLVLCTEDYVKLEVAIGYHDSFHCVFNYVCKPNANCVDRFFATNGIYLIVFYHISWKH